MSIVKYEKNVLTSAVCRLQRQQVLKEVVKAVPELRNLGGNEANPYYAPETVIERELSAICKVCLISLKNTSTPQRARYNSQIDDAAHSRLLVRNVMRFHFLSTRTSAATILSSFG